MLRTIDHNQQPTLNLRSHIPHLLTQSTVKHSNLPYVPKHFTTSYFKLPTLQQISTILFPPYLPIPHVHQRITLLTRLLLATAFGVGIMLRQLGGFCGVIAFRPWGTAPSRRKFVHPDESVVIKIFYITLKQIIHSGATHTRTLTHLYIFIILEPFRESIQNLQKIITFGWSSPSDVSNNESRSGWSILKDG